MHLQVDKPYIALISGTYISLRNQELRTCKNNCDEFYCEEPFVVKHKSNTAMKVLFILISIKKDCNFAFYFNTNLKPAVFDGANEIILVNWPNDKHTKCNIYNDIPVRMPCFCYVMLNGSVLCNCEIEIENHFLLESLAAYQELESKLTIYLTVNLAFVHHFENLTKSLEYPILLTSTTYEQIHQFLWKYLIWNQNC